MPSKEEVQVTAHPAGKLPPEEEFLTLLAFPYLLCLRTRCCNAPLVTGARSRCPSRKLKIDLRNRISAVKLGGNIISIIQIIVECVKLLILKGSYKKARFKGSSHFEGS
jgi:hypothetical protein